MYRSVRLVWPGPFLSLAFLVACQDALPVNRYDPRAPISAQARGAIQGTLFLDDAAATPTVMHEELQALSVHLLDGAGAQLVLTSCPAEDTAASSMACDDAARAARFEFKALPAGDYQLVVDGLNPRYVPLAIPAITLLPGEVKQLGTLRYAVLPIAVPDPSWTGRVEVEAQLAAGEGGARRVTLYRQGSTGLEAHAVGLTDDGGRAVFDEVPPGVYAVAAELDQYTPDYRAGFEILDPATPVEQNTQAFTGGASLTLYPVTAVLIPALQQTFGQYYTNGDVAPVQVLQFGGMNQMRVSTDASFASGTLTWLDYTASTDVSLPSREGTIPIYAQFRNTREPGFTFVSSVYQTAVVRDVSAPEVQGVRVRGRTAGDDGKIWYAADAPVLSVEVDGQDAVSAVYSYALQHDAANSAGDPASLSFALTESPGGLVRLDEEIGLTAGEGEKQVFVYLKDRAGNVSAAGQVAVWVDTIAPVIEALDLGTTWTSRAVVTAGLLASDLNEVVSMQVWEEGQPTPAPVPYAELWTVQLAPLDHARTGRQVNALVYDQAGNVSLLASQTLTFDDRGTLTGVLTVEDAADGSAGSSSGVSALVDGVSRPLQLTATGSRGEFDVVVSAIPAGANRQLVLQKAGYAEAAARAPFTVEAGVATSVGALRLALARGSIEGWVQIEGNAEHSNAIARVEGQDLFALSDASGHFVIDDVPARSGYTLSVRYDEGHGTELITGVDVPAGGVRQVSTSGQPIVLPVLAGSFSIAQGAYTGAQRIQLRMAYDGATQYRASESRAELDNDLIGWTGFSNAVGSTTGYDFDLASGDGVHVVYVQFQDPTAGTGSVSGIFQDAVTLDTQEPVIGALRIDEGSGYTAGRSVMLSIAATDATPIVSYQVSQQDTTDASALVDGDFGAVTPYNNQPVGVDLLGSSFYTARVWVRVIDAAGNVSAPVLRSVVLDPLAPTGASLVINGGADVTSSLQVTLTLTASDDTPLAMLVGNGAVPSTGTWQSFEPSLGWTLSPVGGSTRRVCVAFRDAALHVVTDICDDIGFDATPPPLPDVTLTSGTPTLDPALTLTFNNVTADVASIEVATNGAFAGARSYPDQGQVSYTLPGIDGSYNVFVRYVDAAGNTSPTQVVSVELDRQPPQSVDFAVVDGAYTKSLRPELRLSALGARWMRISATANCAGGTDEDFAPQGFVDLAAPDGLKDISVVFTDAAGNPSDCVPRQVTLDTGLPQPGTPAIAASGLKFVLDPTETSVDAAYVRLDLSVTDATPLMMKVSNVDGCGDVQWEPYRSLISEHELIPGDGPRPVYAMFKDAASNQSSQVSTTVQVNSRGSLTGVLALEGSTDYSDVVIQLDGAAQTYSMATNRFTISNLLTKQYRSVLIRKPNYDDVVLSAGVYVPGGGSADLGTLTVKRSRGSVEGYVELSGDTTHAGVVVELQNTGYTTVSNSAGYFTLRDVLAGSYTLVARKDGYTPRTYAPVVVQSQLTTRVPPVGTLLLSQQQGDFEINGQQGGFTGVQAVTLNLNYTDSVRYRASEDSTFGGGTDLFETFAAKGCTSVAGDHDCPFALQDLDGERTVYVQFEYGSPTQQSEVLQSSIVLDRERPTVGTLLIANGLTSTKELTTSVALSTEDQPYSGVVQMQLSTDGTSWQPAIPFSLTYQWSYSDPTPGSPNPDDNLCLWARYIDAAGNVSSDTVAGAATDCIVLDRQPPTAGAPALSIQNAQGTVLNGTRINSSGVYLVASATGATQMMFSNQSNLAGATYRSYTTAQQDWALAAGDGNRPVYVAYRDQAGNAVGEDGVLFAAVNVDTGAPFAPIFTIAEGAYATATGIHLGLSNRTQGGETLALLVQSDRNLLETFVDESGSLLVAYDLPAVQGVHGLTLRYRDLAGNLSAPATARIALDTLSPAFDSLSCMSCTTVGSTLYSRSGLLRLALSAAPDTAQVRLTGPVLSPAAGTWVAFSAILDVTLDTASQGDKDITVELRDAAGNASTPASRPLTVRYDSQAPSSCSVTLAGYMADGITAAPLNWTATTTVNVAASCAGSPAGMAIVPSTSALDCASASFQAFAASSQLVVTPGDGAKNVKACFRDDAGNTTAATVSAVTPIELDQTPPQSPAIRIDGGAPYTRAPSPHTVTIASTVSGATQVNLSTTGTLNPADWKAWPANNTVNLPTGDGEKWVWAWFRDDLRNTTAVVSDFITLDTTPPADGTVVLASGQATVNTQTIAVHISGTDADAMRLWEVAAASACGTSTCGAVSYVPFAPATSFTLSGSTGDKRVCWHFCDDAGNGSAVGFGNVVLGTYLDRPVPVLGGLAPLAIEALSRETVPEPNYVLTVSGRGIAADTKALIGDFTLDCTSSGASACQPDVGGGCGLGGQCELTCAESCTVDLPDILMRNPATYVVRLFTPSPVEDGVGVSAAARFFNIQAPKPRIDRISPRGVTQLLASGWPVAQTITVHVWGDRIMENTLFTLGGNNGIVVRFDELGDTERYVEVEVSTDGLMPDDLVDSVFSAINPPPGGGIASRPFGINPERTTCDDRNVCDSNLRGTRTPLPGSVGVAQAYDFEATPTWGMVWRGGTAAAHLDSSGELLFRTSALHAGGTLPKIPLLVAATRLEDRQGDQPLVRFTDGVPSGTGLGSWDPVFRGSGTFAAPSSQAAGDGPTDVALADLNGDGKLDLLSISENANVLDWWLRGSATWGSRLTLATPADPSGLAVADLNGDGALDVAVVCGDSEMLSLRLGDGTGGLGARADYSLGELSREVAIGDLDRDGAPDLIALAPFGADRVFYGVGDGSLVDGGNPELGGTSLRLVDVDLDGWLDAVSLDPSADRVLVILNDQAGALGSALSFDSSGDSGTDNGTTVPEALAVVDLDEDGLLDVVVGDRNTNTLYRFAGNGSGGFSYLGSSAAGAPLRDLEGGDFDGDGHVDLAGAVYSGINGALLWRGRGDGSLQGAQTLTVTGSFPVALASGDILGDGGVDLAFASWTSDSVDVLYNQRGAYLSWTTGIANCGPQQLAAGDFNQDGFADVVYSTAAGPELRVGFGSGDGQFDFASVSPPSTLTGSDHAKHVVLPDLDNDGVTDLAYLNYSDQVVVRLGAGDGTFGAETLYAAGPTVRDLRWSDLDRDGNADLLVANRDGDDVTVLWGDGTGDFTAVDVSMGTDPNGVAAGDFNGDGHLDLVVARGDAFSLTFRAGDSARNFATATSITHVNQRPQSVEVVDLQRDGKADLVVAYGYLGAYVLLGRGDGTFTETTYAMETQSAITRDLVAVDLDRDGALDLIGANESQGSYGVRKGDGAGGFGALHTVTVTPGAQTLLARSLLRSGGLDLIFAGSQDLVFLLEPPAGQWTQELSDMPPMTVAIDSVSGPYAATVGQAAQLVGTLAVRLRLVGDDYSGTSASLQAPDGTTASVDLSTCVGGEPCVVASKGFSTMTGRVQPGGAWILTLGNSLATAIQLADFAVITSGHVPPPKVGDRLGRPEHLGLPAGKRHLVVADNNLGYGDALTGACGAGSDLAGEHWYQFALTAANGVTVDVVAGFDAMLALRSGECPSSTPLACRTGGGTGTNPRLEDAGSYYALSAGTYCLGVAGETQGNEGDYLLRLTFQNTLP